MSDVLISLLNGLVAIVLGLINEQLIYIVIASFVITQAVKVGWRYVPNVPELTREAVVFLVAPLVTIPIAYATWDHVDRVPAWVVGIVASLLANVIYVVVMKRYMCRYFPAWYAKLNRPLDVDKP